MSATINLIRELHIRNYKSLAQIQDDQE